MAVVSAASAEDFVEPPVVGAVEAVESEKAGAGSEKPFDSRCLRLQAAVVVVEVAAASA